MIGFFVFFYSSSKTGTGGGETTETTSPFGDVGADKNFGTSTVTQQTDQFSGGTLKPSNKLIQLYKNPTSGSVFFINKNNQNTLRFVDRAVGNVYEYLPEGQTGEVQRVTNTTIPKIQETVWSNTGNNLILRYLDNDTDNINSFSAKIQINTDLPDSLGEITGLFLPQNIKQIVINPKGDKIFTLLNKSDKSGTYGSMSNLDGSNKKTVFDSQISYWNISWPKENTITFTTKPTYKDDGFLYFFNTQTYSIDRVLGNITGLSTITNKDASLVAYSSSINNTFYFNIYDVLNKVSNNLQIPTLVDKCVWGNNNIKIIYCALPKNIPSDTYPDVWYQGLVSFNDDIWKIDTETGNIEVVYQIGYDDGFDIDAFDLKISPDDKYISFSNKKDLSLWLLEIND